MATFGQTSRTKYKSWLPLSVSLLLSLMTAPASAVAEEPERRLERQPTTELQQVEKRVRLKHYEQLLTRIQEMELQKSLLAVQPLEEPQRNQQVEVLNKTLAVLHKEREAILLQMQDARPAAATAQADAATESPATQQRPTPLARGDKKSRSPDKVDAVLKDAATFYIGEWDSFGPPGAMPTKLSITASEDSGKITAVSRSPRGEEYFRADLSLLLPLGAAITEGSEKKGLALVAFGTEAETKKRGAMLSLALHQVGEQLQMTAYILPGREQPNTSLTQGFVQSQIMSRVNAPANLQEELKSADPKIRAKAAKALQGSYVPVPREKWERLLAKIEPGMSREQLMDLLKPHDAKAESSIDEIEDFRLDDSWVLRCVIQREPGGVINPELIERQRSVWVDPAKDFTGTWIVYYTNGHPSHQIEYKDGKYDGEFVHFYSHGEKLFVQHYKQHITEGTDIGYFLNGKVQYQGLYQNGKQVGIWRWYNEDGTLRTTQQHGAIEPRLYIEAEKFSGEIKGRFVTGEKREPLANATIWLCDAQVPVPRDMPQNLFEASPTITFKEQKFSPLVMAFDARRSLRIVNEDQVPTNAQWDSLTGTTFNRLLAPGEAMEQFVAAQKVPGKLQSNLHPDQRVWLFPVPHSFFAVSDGEGKFRLENLPVGQHQARLWHPEHGYLKLASDSSRKTHLEIKPGAQDLEEVLLVSATSATPEPNPAAEFAQVRKQRTEENDRGNASEFVGEWMLRLPRGFEYAVKITQRDDGLLVMDCEKSIVLIGTFAFQKNRLSLVETKESNIHDFVWEYRDGVMTLITERVENGGNYLGATLSRK